MSAQREMRSAFVKVPTVTREHRDNLDVWSEPCGWCSACNRDGVIVVHLGVHGTADVGLCDRCVDRLYAARLEEGSLAPSQPKDPR